ncbi:MAG: hypothetical protein IPM94_14055 [bacterium]|nr:hypothetical protein [bacterium]
MLKAGGVGQACAACHESGSLFPRADLAHRPARDGACSACHDPHGADQPALLRAAGADLCWSCHQDLQAARSLPRRHKPFADGNCATCHDAHGTAQADLLTAAVPALCAKCHDLKSAALAPGPTWASTWSRPIAWPATTRTPPRRRG